MKTFNSIFQPKTKFKVQLLNVGLLLVTLFLVGACTSNSTDKTSAPEGMSTIDLSAYGKPFALFVPDTSKNPLRINESGSGALEVSAGNSFAVSIYEEVSDLNLKRSDITSDEINKLTAYIADEPNAIFWESAITEPEFHFLINLKLAGRDYSFQDIQNTDRKPFNKAATQKMFDSCKNAVELAKKD